ncbi:MAG: hypothetical protein ACO1O6_15060 [Bacteroidota bacterium]
MNKLLLFICSAALGGNLLSQVVVTVKGKHSKELIHTFKKGEFLSRGESRLHIKTDGVGYEFCTMDEKYRYYLYKNGKSLGEFANYTFSDDPYSIKPIRKDEAVSYVFQLKSGEKYGPYESVSPIYDYSNYQINGISYQQNSKRYFKSFITGKTYGPYNDLSISRLTKEEMTYTYKDAKGWYIGHNDQVYGPYKDIRSPFYYNRRGKEKFYFHYQTEKEEWHTFYDQADLPYAFIKGAPSLQVFDNGKVMLNGFPASGNGDSSFTYIDNKRYFFSGTDLEHNSFGDIMVAKPDPENRYYGLSTISIDGQEIGKYKRGYLTAGNCFNSPYFQTLLTDTSKHEVYLYGKGGFQLLDREEEVDNYMVYLVNEDIYHVRKSDRALMKNGKETGHRNVVSMDFSNYPQIIIQKKEGDFDVFYRNDKVMNYDEVRKIKYNTTWLNLKDNPVHFVEIDGKTYVMAKGSSKKFGPVKRYNDFAFSKGNAHLAECDNRKMEIYLDNKLFSPGFSLAYHPQTNAFHWLSIDNNKLYLHTYQND